MPDLKQSASKLFQRFPVSMWVIALGCLLWSMSAQAQRCSEEQQCLFGVFPHSGFAQLQDTYSGIAEDLSLMLDRPVRLVSGSSMAHFQELTEAQRWDIALIGPGQFVSYAQPKGYIPVARSTRLLTYELITLKDKGIDSVGELRGKRLGLMWPNTGTHLMTHKLLGEAGIDPGKDLQTTTYASQHACVHALLIDLVDACGVATSILNILREQKPADYLSIARTQPFAGAMYVVHPSLDEADKEAARDYLQNRPGMQPFSPKDLDEYLHIINSLQGRAQ